MMNAEITGEGKWQMLPTELRLPCQIPDALSSFGSVWEVVGPPQPLLKSAVKAGVCMTAADLQKIQKILKYPLPPRGKGSGKSGNLVKQDFAEALVNMLWPEDTPEEKKRMVDALMGKTLPRVKCASDVIAAVKELGAEAERDFRELHQVALNQEAVEKERRLRGPNVQERQDQKTFTPHSLRKLLPPGQGIGCSRQPVLQRYQAFYPGTMACFNKLLFIVCSTKCIFPSTCLMCSMHLGEACLVSWSPELSV